MRPDFEQIPFLRYLSSRNLPGCRLLGTASLALAVALGAVACGDDGPAEGSSGSDDDGSGGDSSGQGSVGAGTGNTGNGSTSDNSGGSGDVGPTSSSSGSASSSGAGGGGDVCDDGGSGEPENDTVGGAFNLGAISDCDGARTAAAGVLADSIEEDWYVFEGADEFGCVTDPIVTVSPATSVCMYFYCGEGETAAVTCPENSAQSTNDYGDPGCCGADSLAPTVNCEGSSDDSASVYIKVQDSSASCMPYSLTYHY